MLLLGTALSAPSLQAAVRHLCPPVADAFKMDGILDEPQWKNLDTIHLALNNAPAGGKPSVETKVLAAWSATRLYVAFIADTRNVQNIYTKHDDPIYNQDVVELFLDPDGDGKNYFELEWNCLGTSLDFFFTAPLQGENDAWAPQGMEYAVKVHGTANKPSDVDTGMVVEISLPWAAFKQWSKGPMPPGAGDSLALNFYRINYPTPGNQELISWSPTGAADFHRPDKFGTLIFSDQAVTGLFPRSGAPSAAPAAAGSAIIGAPLLRADGKAVPAHGAKLRLFQPPALAR